ncbi:MAG TPA: IclR family transcriptional regulator [Intrasporangium sp.]|nr:IclR family transcriptional regulator [Intrasporangium sp.]
MSTVEDPLAGTAPSESGGASFQRGLRVLIAVAESGETRADEIARDAELPLSTVYRYLRTLREMKFVEERDGSYLLGWRLLELSGQHLTHTRLMELGQSFLRELSEVTGETAVLTVRVGTQAMCLRQVESPHPIRMAFKISQLLPLYAGAGQRMLLAHAPTSVIERVVQQPLRHITTGTLDRAHILKEIEQIRRNGFLVSHGEISDGAVAVAVPVFANGEIACSLTVAGPENRCSPRWVSHARMALRTTSNQLGDVLEQRPRARL